MRKISLFICGLIVSLSAMAQTSVTVSQPHWVGSVKKTIIQEHRSNYPATVTCYNTNDSTVFVYSLGTMQTIEIYVRGFYVNDMIVSGDNVYFCGQHSQLDFGIYGCFNINDLFYGSGQINIAPYLYAGEDGYPVSVLTRMTTIPKADNTEHVVCIGSCKNEGETYPCLLEFEDGLSINNYIGGHVKETYETFCDLDVVVGPLNKSYLVTVGFETKNGRFINARIYDPDDIFSPTGLQDMRHVFSMDTATARPWLNEGIVMSRYKDDYFVTASYRVFSELRDSNFYALNANIHIAKYSV